MKKVSAKRFDKTLKKVLIIGASGFLGTALIKEFSEKFDVIGTSFPEKTNEFIQLDFNNSLQLNSVLDSVFPEIIVLAAAEANIDLYESKPEISFNQINSAKQLTDWTKKNNCFLVFISTDSVFDGIKGNYSESDKSNPLCAYAKNKLETEKIVQQNPNHLILRTSVLFGLPLTENKFIGKAILKLSQGEKVSAASDWKRNPTLTKDFALALIQLLEKKQKGLFHAVGSDALSMHKAALMIAEEFSASEDLVEEIKGSELNLPAKRPLDSSLNTSKLNSFGIKLSSFKEGLKFVHEKMNEEKKSRFK